MKIMEDAIAALGTTWALLAATELDFGALGEKLTSFGLLAAVVWWMMHRQTKAIDDLTSSVDKIHDFVQTNPCRFGGKE